MTVNSKFLIGWSSTDITPEEPIVLRGQFHARVSEGVNDPVTATVLALESQDTDSANATILVSCDLVGIPDCLRDSVREQVGKQLPELDVSRIILSATHTHTGPELSATNDTIRPGRPSTISDLYGVELPVMEPQEYTDRIVQRITRAVVSAWNARRPGKVGFGLAHAVVGHNRRVTYSDGKSRMYGNINDPEFRHVEGYEDHSVNLLGTWNTDGKLTGLVVNVACPSQVSENEYQISADYWHETREELRSRLGDDVHVLAQCSAAGDQSPHLVGNQERNADNVAGEENAEVRMWRLAEHTQREEIAQRIADATEGGLPLMEKERESDPVFEHVVENVQLTRSQITPADVEEARRGAEEWKEKLGKLKNELKENPGERNEPRWYVPITRAYRKVKWFEGVEKRYNIKEKEPKIPVEAHVVRIGDMVFSTNPFEYYLDFGLRMQARSRATQTFTVQLAGSGTYVPTEKAAASGSYGAVPASTTVGPQGGRELVEWSVETINSMWK